MATGWEDVVDIFTNFVVGIVNIKIFVSKWAIVFTTDVFTKMY